MSLKLRSVLRAAFTSPTAGEHHHVHFHSGQGGRVYACDVDRCESAQLSAGEVARLAR